jgi:hypothetical protein
MSILGNMKIGRRLTVGFGVIVSANFVKMSESPPRVKWVSSEIGKDNEYISKKYLND